MGLIMATAMPPTHAEPPISYDWFVGIDWGSQQHQVCMLDRHCQVVGERVVDHDGASLAQLVTWLMTLSQSQPQRVSVGIEVPRGPLVEGLIERGCHVWLLLGSRVVALPMAYHPTLVILSSLKLLFFHSLKNESRFSDNVRA
jgi:Transposase